MKVTVTRADKIGSPGSISREIVSHVIDSDLVIADVSDNNPNVFYELAIRNTVKKPVIIFKGINQRMPFDIYDKRAISIERGDPRIWDTATKALKTQILDAEKNPKLASDSILTNYSFGIDTKDSSRQSGVIPAFLLDLRQEVRQMSKDFSNRYVSREERHIKAVQDSVKEIPKYVVKIKNGSSVPGCEKNDDCFNPSTLKIKRGESVLWSNEDSAAHTVTSGSIDGGGPDGNFDSSLFMAGNTFSFKFDQRGEYPYFDMVHPCMTGTIIVE